MSSLGFVRAALLVTITSSTVQAFPAGPETHTEAFEDVRQVIDQAVEAYGPEATLVVFDTDNTTLATDADLGSEHWFLWQSDMIKAGDFTHGAVARSIPE